MSWLSKLYVSIAVLCLTITMSASFAASSSALVNPETPQEMRCEFERRVAQWVIYHVNRGLSEEVFWEKNKLPDDWSDEIKAASRKIVTDAYAWTGSEADFITQVKRKCSARMLPEEKDLGTPQTQDRSCDE